MSVVVDTNVPVVANGRSRQASGTCVRACIQRLRSITEDIEPLVLDAGWRILREYRKGLRSEGQPGVGDEFLKWVLTNHANPRRCDLVLITHIGPGDSDFAEFPTDPDLAGFDPSDRKFVAVALAHPQRPPVLNAVDRDWWDYREALERNGVTVDFLCPLEVPGNRQ